jgi:ArsR family transcriptional regulator, virulence genes transcriptional regulator
MMLNKYNLELYKLKADISKAFSDPKRLMIINELRDGEKTVGELVETLEISQAIISRELGILKSKGVVKPRRMGNNIYYSLISLRICEACDIVHEVLLEQLSQNKKLAESFLM